VEKTARKTEPIVLCHSIGFPSGLSFFLVSSVCFLVRVTVVDKKGCRLLFANHLGHNFNRKEEKIA
jgi:hypothetical protein